MKPREKIIHAFHHTKKRSLYFNELVRFTQLSHSSLQYNLDTLNKEGLIKTQKEIAHRFYTIKNSPMIAIEFAKLAYKNFEKLDIQIKAPLLRFLESLPRTVRTVILFGSCATNSHTKNSDIDIALIHDSHIEISEIISKINASSLYPLSVFHFTVEEFLHTTDDVLLQAKKTGFPVRGAEFYYEAQINE